MADIKRFCCECKVCGEAYMCSFPDGEYVKFSDYDQLRQRLGEAGELPPLPEPEAWTFQHEETGRMTTLANDGVNNPDNFVVNNPRHVLCDALYSAKQMREYRRLAGGVTVDDDGSTWPIDWTAAHQALETMDDFARMGGITPTGPMNVLRTTLRESQAQCDELRVKLALAEQRRKDIGKEYNDLILHMNAGGDFFEFQRDIAAAMGAK